VVINSILRLRSKNIITSGDFKNRSDVKIAATNGKKNAVVGVDLAAGEALNESGLFIFLLIIRAKM
jgi:hypothetical protein